MSFLHQLFADDDGVLEVVAVPGHEGHQHVAAQGQFAVAGGGAVGDDLALLHLLAQLDDRLLVQAGPLVEAHELAQRVHVGADLDPLRRRRRSRCPSLRARTTMPRVRGPRRFSMPVATSGGSVISSGTAWRCMLEPIKARLASSCSRNGIRPADTPTICSAECRCTGSVRPATIIEVAVVPGNDACRRWILPSAIEDVRPGPGSASCSSSARSHSISSVSLPFFTLRYGRDQEAVLVDAGVDRQAGDQADVRAFRRLDRADAAVVRDVHVADFEARPLAVQAARAQGRQPPLVREHRQRVGLVHHLRQLAAAEEVFDGRGDALGVDQARGGVMSSASLRLMRSCTVRRSLRKPLRSSSQASSSIVRRRRLPRWSMSSISHRRIVVPQLQQVADGGDEVLGPAGSSPSRACSGRTCG